MSRMLRRRRRVLELIPPRRVLVIAHSLDLSRVLLQNGRFFSLLVNQSSNMIGRQTLASTHATRRDSRKAIEKQLADLERQTDLDEKHSVNLDKRKRLVNSVEFYESKRQIH